MRVLMLTRRDTLNPEGGGSEVYLESIARGLVANGHAVTIFCAAHEAASATDTFDGVQVVRRGSKTGVHLAALAALRRREFGDVDVIVDVQNGMPFFSRLVARKVPTVVLVHHIHREQWPVVYGPVRSRIGWFLESQVAPRSYRNSQYVAVSEDTKNELVALGVRRSSITVIHNGTYGIDAQPVTVAAQLAVEDADLIDARLTADSPRIVVLGRLVPHKRVEHVFAAAANLRNELPDLRVVVIGDGWWASELRASAVRYGVADIVAFTGFISEAAKHEQLAGAWVLAMPSLKEGWGIVIMEAAHHGVPAVGYRSAGGVAESIVDGESGILVDGGPAEFEEALKRVLADAELRARLGEGARKRTTEFSWDQAVSDFEVLLQRVVRTGRST